MTYDPMNVSDETVAAIDRETRGEPPLAMTTGWERADAVIEDGALTSPEDAPPDTAEDSYDHFWLEGVKVENPACEEDVGKYGDLEGKPIYHFSAMLAFVAPSSPNHGRKLPFHVRVPVNSNDWSSGRFSDKSRFKPVASLINTAGLTGNATEVWPQLADRQGLMLMNQRKYTGRNGPFTYDTPVRWLPAG